METKKTKKADLRSKQGLFMQIGFITALSLVFTAFQWATPNKNEIILSGSAIIDYEPELIPITRPKKPIVKLAPPKKALQLIIIEGPVDFEEEPMDFSSEADENTYIKPIALEAEPEEVEVDHFVIVETMPIFPGGDKALLRYIAKKIEYPEKAKRNGMQGRVYVSFIINKQGLVRDVKVVRSVDSSLDKEAIRVISNMPQWEPGKQRGKAVNVCFTVPINFKLH